MQYTELQMLEQRQQSLGAVSLEDGGLSPESMLLKHDSKHLQCCCGKLHPQQMQFLKLVGPEALPVHSCALQACSCMF